MKRSERIFQVAVLLFAVSAVSALAVFAYVGVKKSYWQNADRFTAASREAETKWQKLEASQSDWGNIEKEYARFRQEYLLKESDFATFRSDLDNLLQTCSLQRKSISFGSTEITHMRLRHYKVSIGVSGEYPSLKRFIHAIENQKPIVFISKIDIGQEKNQLTAVIDLEAYFAL